MNKMFTIKVEVLTEETKEYLDYLIHKAIEDNVKAVKVIEVCEA